VLLKNSGNVLPLKKNAKVYVAGRNADDIGNQAGGWTVQWQGVAGDGVIPGTTVVDRIRRVDSDVTYSEDGSAPTAGADVGVVVVGETPYAEGFGDVGGPTCNFCTPQQLEPKSLTLDPADGQRRPGADQRRRPELRAGLPVRVGAADRLAAVAAAGGPGVARLRRRGAAGGPGGHHPGAEPAVLVRRTDHGQGVRGRGAGPGGRRSDPHDQGPVLRG
jgi:hypothetical protein